MIECKYFSYFTWKSICVVIEKKVYELMLKKILNELFILVCDE